MTMKHGTENIVPLHMVWVVAEEGLEPSTPSFHSGPLTN